MLQRKPSSRLGYNGPSEVKSHPWFDGFPWEKLEEKQLIAPFIPDSTDNFDVKVTNDGWKDEDSDKMKEANLLLRRETVQDLFKGYYYDQSFESFGYNIEEKYKTAPRILQQRRGPPSRTMKPSPSRNSGSNKRRVTRSNSGVGRSRSNVQPNNIASASTEEGKNNI